MCPNIRLFLLMFTLNHLKRIQSFLSFNRYLITFSAPATHCDHNSGNIYQVMEIRTQVWSKWITVWFQMRSIDNVQSSTLSQPTAAAGGSSHLHSLAYLAVALVVLLLVPVIGIPIHIDEQMIKAPAFSV